MVISESGLLGFAAIFGLVVLGSIALFRGGSATTKVRYDPAGGVEFGASVSGGRPHVEDGPRAEPLTPPSNSPPQLEPRR